MNEREKNRLKYPITAEIIDKVRVFFPETTVKSTTEKPLSQGEIDQIIEKML